MLFGHQNDDVNQAGAPAPLGTPPVPPTDTPALNPLDADAVTGAPLPVVAPGSESDTAGPSVLNQPAADSTSPFAPADPSLDTPAPAGQSEAPSASTPAEEPPVSSSTPASDDLLQLKQQALTQLGPLVNHLDQSPEEKFRTTMMLLQSTDNQALLQTAYEAANAIPDEKARAQALLDVVNEINYFTQQKQ